MVNKTENQSDAVSANCVERGEVFSILLAQTRLAVRSKNHPVALVLLLLQ